MAGQALPVDPPERAIAATAILSFVAGFVDVVGFVALFGLFTSHVTGNFVVMGSEIVHASSGVLAKLLALPMFAVSVALTRLVVLRYEMEDRSPLLALLVGQVVLLLAFLLAGVAASPIVDPDAAGPIAAGLLGVAAMGVQNAAGRLVLSAHAPTTIMTGNTTQAVIDLVDMYRSEPAIKSAARDRLRRTVPGILAFAAGAIAGAYGFLFAAFWCLAIPVAALAGVAYLARQKT